MQLQKYVWAPLLLFFTSVAMGQELIIHVKLADGADQKVFLASHYLGNIYAKDTIQLDETGSGVFKADSLLPQGLYKIFLDENHHFDFLLGADQQLSISNESFSAETMRVEGAVETAAFADYMAFLKNLQDKRIQLREKTERADTRGKPELQQELAGLTNQLYAYWEFIEMEYPESFLKKFVKANHVPVLDTSTLPEAVQRNDSLLLKARFNYQQTHFWDHFDYTDERFLYTPFFKARLETWFTKVLYQHYDSVRHPVFNFIEDVRPHRRIFQFVTSFFLNSSINSNIMGMDALFVDLAREYYLSGEAFWATDESLQKIRENVLFAENNLIGMTAPDLTLESFDGEFFNLHQVDAVYTLLVIYEPDCSHCSVFVPELYNKVYLPFRDRGVEVYAIYSMDRKEEWRDFLTEHGLLDWINVWDEHHVSRFKILYDARTTPGLYVLDQNKQIIAKKLTVEQVSLFLEKAFN